MAGEQAIADMFHFLTVHYYEHEAELQAVIALNQLNPHIPQQLNKGPDMTFFLLDSDIYH